MVKQWTISIDCFRVLSSIIASVNREYNIENVDSEFWKSEQWLYMCNEISSIVVATECIAYT